MFCPDCGEILDDVDPADPCPGCDGNRRSANVPAQSAMGSVAAPQPTIITHSRPGDIGEEINVGAPRYRSSSTADPKGGRQVFDGEPPRNEEDVQLVCDILREALAQVGKHWGPFIVEPETSDSDVDAVAEDGHGGHLRVQVTRAEQDIWEEVARTGGAETVETGEQRAAAIWYAITKKSKNLVLTQRARLVLVVDANRTPGYLRRNVIDVFRAHYGDQATSLGYIAIWLVGPTAADLTRQLS
jgi:hypothetical protein